MLSEYYTDNLNTMINLLDIVQIQPKPGAVGWPDTLHCPHSADVELFSCSINCCEWWVMSGGTRQYTILLLRIILEYIMIYQIIIICS